MQQEPFKSNFNFLKTDFPLLQNIAASAEYYLHTDPAVSLSKLRLFLEKVTDLLLDEHFLEDPYDNSLDNRIRLLKREEVIIEAKIDNCFYFIRTKANKAIHKGRANVSIATQALRNAFSIAEWLQDVYGEKGELPDKGFLVPPNLDARHALHELREKYDQLEKDHQDALEEIRKAAEQKSEVERKELIAQAYEGSRKLSLSEGQTRAIIDRQLRNAGWDADTENLTFAAGTRPEKGRNLAIAEWPVAGGRADYALFIGMTLYGVVEAKKKSRETLSDMAQAKRYSTNVQMNNGEELLGRWGAYRVPFMFTTNGTLYHFQLENRSGTWFLDGREASNHPRPLKFWFSPRDLEELYKKDLEAAREKLANDPYLYLKDPKGLNLRYYQIEAIQAVENTVVEPDRDRALLAMATGTGKTRTVMGLCYRLLKSTRFNRILFLVDRTILGTQAADSFKDVIIEDLETFGKIYDLKEIGDIIPELDTKVHFSTVQGMYRRLFDRIDDESYLPTVGTYDCIIVDEAHRGYNLDLEMDDYEVLFKDQSDYRSKYKMVVEYFDAFRIGLTATPAPHTVNVFGHPVYEYTYRRAVIDGFLVDYEPPYIIRTQLSEEGISWGRGETIKVYDRFSKEIEELENLEDEVRIEVEGFNKMVLTESFNRVILDELTRYIDPYGPDKTLIFCASDDHASDVVRWLKQAFEESGLVVDDNAIRKITGSVDKPGDAVKYFKNENQPVIVTTVDLLTTGVDVPEICNLVFLRRVNSRILYEQMLGRATRLAPDIGKEAFRIFDAVGLYQNMEKVSNMKPVVTRPQTSFSGLVEEFTDIEEKVQLEADKKEAQQRQLDQIVAKIQRKKNKLTDEQVEQFKLLSGGLTPDEFISQLHSQETQEAVDTVRQRRELFARLDEMKGVPRVQYISEHEDVHLATDRDYTITYNAEDYLENFRTYILDNRNKLSALEIVCARPNSLSREDLKQLRLELSLHGFDAIKLREAWKTARNEDIAADIIAYIRSLALGDQLIPQEERIRKAMAKVRSLKNWTRPQQTWLDRFEKQLIKESILHKEDLDQGIFKREGGGYQRLNKIFDQELDQVLHVINDNLYGETG